MSDDVVEAEGAVVPESVEPADAEPTDAEPAAEPAQPAAKKPAAPRKPRTAKPQSAATAAKATSRAPRKPAAKTGAKAAADGEATAKRPTKPRTPAKPKAAPKTAAKPKPAPKPAGPPVLVLKGLTKRFGDVVAVDEVTLSLDQGTFTGIVGPNGAGKTTTLSMVTGLLRPTSGEVLIGDIDVWKNPQGAKRLLGVLPDRLHTFDRLTGAQLLYYTAILHGLDRETATTRTRELAEAFKVEHAMTRLVTDYSTGMLKKIALAAALIHAPRVLVLDEPFESVDPVSAMTVAKILKDFVAAGGTVLLSSHSMELVERICDHVAVIVDGRLIAGGTVDEVRGDQTLQERFIDLAGADTESIADLTWLHRFSA